MISRGFTWHDDNGERTDDEIARATALARKWSALQSQREADSFKRQSDIEDFGFAGPEPCESCEECLAGAYEQCSHIKRCAELERDKNATQQVEIEIVERMLQEMGARMMRPYEHWNEDERLVEYLENRYE